MFNHFPSYSLKEYNRDQIRSSSVLVGTFKEQQQQERRGIHLLHPSSCAAIIRQKAQQRKNKKKEKEKAEKRQRKKIRGRKRRSKRTSKTMKTQHTTVASSVGTTSSSCTALLTMQHRRMQSSRYYCTARPNKLPRNSNYNGKRQPSPNNNNFPIILFQCRRAVIGPASRISANFLMNWH